MLIYLDYYIHFFHFWILLKEILYIILLFLMFLLLNIHKMFLVIPLNLLLCGIITLINLSFLLCFIQMETYLLRLNLLNLLRKIILLLFSSSPLHLYPLLGALLFRIRSVSRPPFILINSLESLNGFNSFSYKI